MNQNVNYYKEFLMQYREIRKHYKDGELPKLLLHVCCGACSAYPLVFLVDLFDVTILFSNSNIYPYEEFMKREEALRKHVNNVNKMFHTNTKIIIDDYKYDDFKKDLIPFKDQPEGQNRCKICITKRMENAFNFAKNNGFKYLTTTMTVSRNKDVKFINEIGEKLMKKYPEVYFVHSDFKKNGGQDLGVRITKLEDIYRQDYCGCEFSKRDENE